MRQQQARSILVCKQSRTKPEVPVAQEHPAENVSALLIGELHIGMVRTVNTDSLFLSLW